MTEPDFAARNQVDVMLRERSETLTKLWLVATFAIGLVAIVLAAVGETMPAELPGAVVTLAWLVAGLLALLSVVLPQRELGDPYLDRWLRLPVDAHRWAKQMRFSVEQRDAFIALPPAEQSVFGLTLLFERPYWLGLGLSFGVALVGLVYGLLTHTVLEAAPFLTAALVLNCWHYPRPRLRKLIERGRSLQSRAEEESEAAALANLHVQQATKDGSPRGPRPTPRLRNKTRPNEQA